MGNANGTQLRLVDANVELRRETRDFARWTLEDVEELHRRFKKTFGFAVTASQFESLLLLKAPDNVGIEEIFEALDTNRDGRVDGLELLAALACVCRGSFEAKARFAFDLFDFNHNGSLSIAELALLMKSVLIGMTLLTGGRSDITLPPASQHATNNGSSMEAMLLCLDLAESAFARGDKNTSTLNFEAFIAWARSNRDFMMQVERFRLIAEKAVGFEDALSLPDGSDDDSDLDVEFQNFDAADTLDLINNQRDNDRKRPDIPFPWTVEPSTQPSHTNATSSCKDTGMPPPVNLQLEWVYGSNGPSSRNSSRLLATGEAVYFVGSYVVLYSSESHEQRYYHGHRRAIGCLDVNANGEIVATGDTCVPRITGGAEIHVWNARTLQCLAVLRNFHPAGVNHVSFPATASAATATLHQAQVVSTGERSGAGGHSSALLSSNLLKKKPQETEALLASIGNDDGGSMALWNWQKEAVVASGRAHPAATGRRANCSRGGKQPLALALNEDGDEIVVVGAHFVVFHQIGGRFFKHKKPHWHGSVDPPMQEVPTCVSAIYYGIQSVVVGTARGELLLFERHTLTRCVQAHDVQSSVNVCLLSCQSMVLFSAGKDGQIKQWDSTLRPIGQTLDLHTSLHVPEITSASSSISSRPENVLEGDDFRISSLDYDARRQRFLVGTRTGNIFEIDDEKPSRNSTTTASSSTFRWRIVASGHTGHPTCDIATASAVGGCFASCGVRDRFVKLWSLRRRSFVQQLRFPGAIAYPSALVFSSDGDRLAVGGGDGTVMLARRSSESSSSLMTIETTMKNTNSAVVAMRFGPLKTESLLAVTRENGLIYLYKVEPGGRRFSRYMLLRPQAMTTNAGDTSETTPAHALDFSVDGGFLRTQHGPSSLSFWDLRQHAGTRVTSMAILRNVEWHTQSISIGWAIGGLPLASQQIGGNAGVSVSANAARGLALVLSSEGDVNLAPFPCPQFTASIEDSTEIRWLTKGVPQVHLVGQAPPDGSSRPPLCGDFALRGSMIITSSHYDPAICQWRVEKELGDIQPRPKCLYDTALRKRLSSLGLRDVYFGWDTFNDSEKEGMENQDVKHRQALLSKTSGDNNRTIAVRTASTISAQRSEAPDLSLTLSYAHGFNHFCTSVNQSMAGLGNGSYVYGAGTLLVVRHLRSFGSRQRLVPSGLRHSVSCVVKHPSEPILAVGSRTDGRVVLLRTEKSPTAAGLSGGDSFQRVATLKPVNAGTSRGVRMSLIAVAFCDSNDSNTRNAQSDLAAVIWKQSSSQVHTLVFYAWKRQLLLAHSSMTRLPVLFGVFTGSSTNVVHFVSGGIDHVTFWQLKPSTGHATAQQGVFGRHARVQTILCAVHIAPFTLTGGEDGSVVVWESGVAAHTASASNSYGNGVVQLEHLQSSQQVLGALRCGSLVVWKYTTARSPTRGGKSSGSRAQADTFLQLMREISVIDVAKAISVPVASTGFVNEPPPDDVNVQGFCLLDDPAIAAVVLNNGRVLSVDLELILEDTAAENQRNGGFSVGTGGAGDKARILLDFNGEVDDVALHPRDLRWASASTDGRVCVWNLHTNLLLQQQVMPSAPRSLAWSSTGEHLAVSLSSGTVVILDGTTLELLLQFTCGESENGPTKSAGFPKWCTIVKYSPENSQPGSNVTRNWLALACRDYNIYVYASESTGTESSPPVYTLGHTFVGHTAPIEALDFSLDGEWLQSATSSSDRQLLRWALRKESSPTDADPPTQEKLTGLQLLDDAWASWTLTFAGPVTGLAEYCGVGKSTSMARINSDYGSSKNSESEPSKESWSSSLSTMIVGLDDGHLMLAWYPLTRGDVTMPTSSVHSELNTPAALAKEYIGCFPRDSLIRRVAFSFANAFVVALARDSIGGTQVLLWKTDFEDELRLRQRFAVKAPPTSVFSPNWYTSPVDRTLLDMCTSAPKDACKLWTNAQRSEILDETDDKWAADDNSGVADDKLYLEFIYGINPGATASRNVFYADDAWEIVYAAGACGVVYNTKTQTQLLNCRAESELRRIISALAVHPKGDLVASGECLVAAPSSLKQSTPEIVIWDANSGSTIARVTTKHRPGVLLLEFSQDGHRLASIGMEADHTLALYTISGGESERGRLHATLTAIFKTSTRRVWGLSFGEDGELVTCGDQHILFWQQSTASEARVGDEEVRTGGLKSGLLSSHRDCNPQATLLQAAHISGRSRIVASSQADGSIYIWKDRVCVLVRRDAHGNTPIPALAVDRKQALLYSAGGDGRICTWNVQLELVRVVADVAQLNTCSLPTGKLLLTSTQLQSIAVRDGHVLFTTSGGEVCELVDANILQQKAHAPSTQAFRIHVYVRGHDHGQLCGLAMHPTKRAQFASAGDNGVVRLWDAATRSLLALHQWNSASELATGSSNELRALAFSADGKHLAVGTLDGIVRILTATLDGVVTQWSCWRGQQQPRHAVLELKYSTDGKLLAVGGQDGCVHVYNAVSYQKLTVLKGFTLAVDSMRLDFARDRAVLRASANGSNELQFWELGSWRALSPVEVRDLHWESRRHPSRLNGTSDFEDIDAPPSYYTKLAAHGHSTPVSNWTVTKNERFLLSTGGYDRVICQFRLMPSSA